MSIDENVMDPMFDTTPALLTFHKRTCSIHGPQGDESVTIRITGKPEYYCLACFAAWVRANLQPLTDTKDGAR